MWTCTRYNPAKPTMKNPARLSQARSNSKAFTTSLRSPARYFVKLHRTTQLRAYKLHTQPSVHKGKDSISCRQPFRNRISQPCSSRVQGGQIVLQLYFSPSCWHGWHALSINPSWRFIARNFLGYFQRFELICAVGFVRRAPLVAVWLALGVCCVCRGLFAVAYTLYTTNLTVCCTLQKKNLKKFSALYFAV